MKRNYIIGRCINIDSNFNILNVYNNEQDDFIKLYFSDTLKEKIKNDIKYIVKSIIAVSYDKNDYITKISYLKSNN